MCTVYKIMYIYKTILASLLGKCFNMFYRKWENDDKVTYIPVMTDEENVSDI